MSSLALLLCWLAGLPAGPRAQAAGPRAQAAGPRAQAAGPRAQERGAAATDGELAPLAAALAGYMDALEAGGGLAEARSALAALDPPLARPDEFGRAVWLAGGFDAGRAETGKVVADVERGGSFGPAGLAFAYRLPKGYDPERAGNPGYPLILAIPDQGQDPSAHLRESWTHAGLLDGAVLVCPAMPAERAEWTAVMVAGRPGGLSHVLTALRLSAERFALDPERIFVAGSGKGVPAAVAAGDFAPQRFAGVIGRAGDLAEVDLQGPWNFSNLPTWFAGAGARASAFRDAARAAGFDNCTLVQAGSEADLWTWIQARRRARYPERVELKVGLPFPTRAYWLRVAPSAPDARATAVLDREGNALRVDGSGVSSVTLYLDDGLLDLGRPVTLVCNGVLSELRVERSLSTALQLLAEGTSDAGTPFVAEVVRDMGGAGSARPDAPAPLPDAGFEQRFEAAGNDVRELLALRAWCDASGRADAARAVLERIVRLEPDQAEARAALGHRHHAGQWFRSEAALARFLAGQEEAGAAARGWVKHGSLWMHPADRSLAGKGLAPDLETGLWLTQAERRRLAQGWARQDFEWIPPDQAGPRDRGLWRVDGEWVDTATADRRHARLETPWHIPGPEVVLHATVDRAVAERAQEVMGRALADLFKVFGAEPRLPLEVAVVRDEEQYDRFAFGDPDGRRQPRHAGRLHVIHSAFFAESWFPLVDGRREFRGLGVCVWDQDAPHGDLYGVHAARLALGLSFVEALDPSPKAVKRALASGPEAEYYAAYQAEKRLPAWLRWGGAVYAERFFEDDAVEAGGDRWWARKWSLENLAASGGARPLEQILEFALDPAQREPSQKLLIEAGLLVAFLVDGGVPAVTEAHAAFQRALSAGRLRASDVQALTAALAAHPDELAAFARP